MFHEFGGTFDILTSWIFNL